VACSTRFMFTLPVKVSLSPLARVCARLARSRSHPQSGPPLFLAGASACRGKKEGQSGRMLNCSLASPVLPVVATPNQNQPLLPATQPPQVNWEYFDQRLLRNLWQSHSDLQRLRLALPDMADRCLVFHRCGRVHKVAERGYWSK
jgi:hypothetical protein